MARDISQNLPEKAILVSPVRACGGTPADGFPTSFTTTVNLSDVEFTDPSVDNAGQPEGVAGTTLILRDTVLALFDTAAGPPTNSSTLMDLATQAFQDFADWSSWSIDQVINGVAAVVPNGLLDVIEFTYTATEQTTRIQSQPFNGYPQEFQRLDPATSATDCQSFSRVPGILLDIPGAMPGQSSQAVVSLEDGRLVLTYDNTMAVPCGCGTVPMLCGCVCIVVLSACGVLIPGLSLTATAAGFSQTCGPTINFVASITRVLSGSGYTSQPTITFLGGLGIGGSSATANATIVSGVIVAINVTAFGSGYTSTPTVVITGGGGSGATATATVVDGLVTAVTVTAGGSGYTSVTVTGGGGTGATAQWGLAFGKVTSIAVVVGGTGYTAAPAVVFAGGGGSGAAATSTVSGGHVTGFTITSMGSGYSTPPTVSLGGPGSGALAAAVITGDIAGIQVTNGGSGFTSTPTVVFSVGTGATATVTMGSEVCIQTTANSTYTVTSSSPDYATQTVGSNTVTDCEPFVRTITMALASGFSCSPDPCCPTGEQHGPPYPVPFFSYPTTIHLNDGFSTVALTKSPTSPGVVGTYSACVMRTAATATTSCSALVTGTSLDVPVAFQMFCSGSQWRLLIETPVSPFNGTTGSGNNEYPDSLGTCGTTSFGVAQTLNCAGSNTVGFQAQLATASSCTSFALSFTFVFDSITANSDYCPLWLIYGTSPILVTVAF